MPSDVAICMPFYDTGCRHRRRAMEWTTGYWTMLGFDVVSGDGPTRSAARNDAARKTDASVLVFADADTWCDVEQLADGVARVGDGLVYPYVKHLRLNQVATAHLYETGQVTRSGQTILDQSLGIVVCSRGVFDEVGGFDERFTVWGGEDRSFRFAVETLCGPSQRIDGFSYHLWHPRGRDQWVRTAERKAMYDLALRYKEAAGSARQAGILRATKRTIADPDAMRALLSEPGGPKACATYTDVVQSRLK